VIDTSFRWFVRVVGFVACVMALASYLMGKDGPELFFASATVLGVAVVHDIIERRRVRTR
jgi:small basic protein